MALLPYPPALILGLLRLLVAGEVGGAREDRDPAQALGLDLGRPHAPTLMRSLSPMKPAGRQFWPPSIETSTSFEARGPGPRDAAHLDPP